MAASLARSILSPDLQVVAASPRPGATLPAAAWRVMEEIGIDAAPEATLPLSDVSLAGHRLIHLDAKHHTGQAFTMFEHWPLPLMEKGDEESLTVLFRTVRDQLVERISILQGEYPVEPAVGVIGGSGFYNLPGVEDLHEVTVATPFGAPSDALFVGRLGGKKVVFLPRHGRTHSLTPSEVNGRANIYAMKRLGVTHLISVSAVGSLREAIAPGHVVFPRQFIDRTMGRPSTFFGNGLVAHVSLADPVCNALADSLVSKARRETSDVHAEGVYVCMEGPQFSTRAESHFYRSIGGDVIGMTNLPEAKLAREAEICYATMTLPTDYDCWRTATEEVNVAEIIAVLHANVAKAQRILSAAIQGLDAARGCSCRTALDMAIFTPLATLSPSLKLRLGAILERRLQAERVVL